MRAPRCRWLMCGQSVSGGSEAVAFARCRTTFDSPCASELPGRLTVSLVPTSRHTERPLRLFRPVQNVGPVAGVRERCVVADFSFLIQRDKRTVHRLHLVFLAGLHFAVELMHLSFADMVAHSGGGNTDLAGQN